MKSSFEKYAKNKLDQHTSDVDAEALWSVVAPQVKPKRKRRLILIFLFGIGLIGMGTLIYTNYQSTLAQVLVETVEPEEDAGISMEMPDPTGVKAREEKSTQSITPKKEVVTENKLEDNRLEIQTQSSMLKLNGRNINTTELIESNHPEKAMVEKKTIMQLSKEISKTIAETKTVMETKESLMLNDWQKIELKEIKELEIKLSDLPEVPLQLVSLSELPEKENYHWRIGVHGGISYSFMKLDTIRRIFVPYLEPRRETETQLETLHFGLDISRAINKNWYVKSGIEYTRIARKFQQEQRSMEYLTMDTINGIFINTTTMDTIYNRGSVVLNRQLINRKRTYNYFHLLDIPVLAGYQIKKDHWTLGVEAGVLVNIFTKSSGEILDLRSTTQPINKEVYDITNDRKGWFSDRLGLRGIINLKGAYQLNSRWELSLSPTLRFGSEYNGGDNPIRQTSVELGGNIGLNYLF